MTDRATYTLVVGWECQPAGLVKLQGENGKVGETYAGRMGGMLELVFSVPRAQAGAVDSEDLKKRLEAGMHETIRQWQGEITPNSEGEGAE